MLPSRKLVVCLVALLVLAGLTSRAPAAQLAGRIWSVTPSENRMTVTDQYGRDWIISVDSQATIEVNAIPSFVTDLMAGDLVKVAYTQQGNALLAYDISALRE